MDQKTDAPSPWVTVAKLTNLAEVGYFADLLESGGFSTNVDRRDEFSAIDGSWTARYLLQVLPEHGLRAAELMKQQLVETDAYSTDDDNRWDRSDPHQANLARRSSIVYRATMSILLIGVVLLVAERMSRSRIGVPTEDSTLWDAIKASRTEFRTSEAANSDTRLLHDENSDSILLIDDLDRDGRFDRLRRYRDGQLVETIEK